MVGNKMTKGRLIGIGVGPGDSELLTLKAHRLLQTASVIAYPATSGSATTESFAKSIVSDYLPADIIEIPIILPMNPDPQSAQLVYDESSKAIESHLRTGSDVIVLCEGDPFFYGSFIYLHRRLSPSYDCDIIPGVSSIMASSCALGRPLSARNDILTIVPATCEDSIILSHLRSTSSLAFIKIGRHLARIKKLIEQESLLDSSSYLERVSLSDQKIMSLSDKRDEAAYFSIILLYRGTLNE